MTRRRLFRLALIGLLTCLAALGLVAGGLWWYFHPEIQRAAPVTYTQRQGRELQFGVLRGARTNGLAVVLLVSGSWKSSGPTVPDYLVAPLIRRGFTVFAVAHGSQPQCTVMEIVEDVQRAVRFIRRHAREYGIEATRLGVTGGSSGGHLSLMLATRGGPGPANAADPVDRESSAVQAVACFFPATDLLNLGKSTENPGDGGPPKSFVKAFGPNATNLAVWKVLGRELSPIYHVTTNLPPVLILHGDADTLVPLDQSERFAQRAREVGRPVELIVRRGKKHGWLTMLWDIRRFADWFDRHLREPEPDRWDTRSRSNRPSDGAGQP